jgi:hypothetical protein
VARRNWPLKEFWADKVKPFRKVVDEFIQPIIQDALAKHAAIEDKLSEGEKANDDSHTLLTHLFSYTQGFPIIYSKSCPNSRHLTRYANIEGRGGQMLVYC